MYLKVGRDHLLDAVQKVIGAIEKKQTLPILNSLLVRVSENCVLIMATDLEIELKTTIFLDEKYDFFEFTMPAKKIADISKNLRTNSEIEIHLSSDNLILISYKSKFNLSLLPTDDFPKNNEFSGLGSITLSKNVLKGLINKVSFSMAQQDVRYYLNGMLFEIEENKVTSVTTDGHRLALCCYESESLFEGKSQFIIPRKTVIELQKLLNDDVGEIKIEFEFNQIRFTFGETVLTSKLVDGKFPDYKRVIPIQNEKNALVDSSLLRQALIRSSIISNDKFKGAKFSFSTNLLIIESQNSEKDKSREELFVEYNSDELNIGFNIYYLIDIINVISDEKILLSLHSPDSSVVIKSKDDSLNSTFVVMPMRI